ncbi:chaperonin 10-like protein [Stachybotrys elegans]|uniref:Chaperonin 10-like protein n=1 Tax=Stachybotrys elegans TaxID=80388 RepID=A0A8K0SS97_9HYPO|nr:chaperonin 10-like protein [Stachybotrys elegans]
MKEAIVAPDLSVTIHDVPIPAPGPHEILVKVLVAGTNPKDWKFPEVSNKAHNSGDDLAGIVEAVGEGVCEFRNGDRVAGMHAFPLPHGAFAEYAILRDYMAFHIPENVSFEEAATIPLAYLTAAFGLFHVLGLPPPWHSSAGDRKVAPLAIYGASTAVGAFAIKLARASSIHPLIAIGSDNSSFTHEYIDAAAKDVFINYRAHKSSEDLASAIKQAALESGVPDGRLPFAFDAVALPQTYKEVLGAAMAGPPINGARPKLAVTDPFCDANAVDPSVDLATTYCGFGHEGDDAHARNFTAVVFRMATKGLMDGWLKGHPYEVAPGGLSGVRDVLLKSKNGEIKGKKLVLRLSDTPGL